MGQNLLPLSGNTLDCVILPDELLNPLMETMEGPLEGRGDEPCVWLDRTTGKCLHHEHRPSFCRDFECGSVHCERRRAECGLNDTEE